MNILGTVFCHDLFFCDLLFRSTHLSTLFSVLCYLIFPALCCTAISCEWLRYLCLYFVDLTTTKCYAEDEVDQFINYIDNIKVSDGGDCPEFSFDGMINSLYEDPRWGSPLYVFTDAPPIDADEENKETLRVLAEDLGVTVNFFAGKTVCGSEAQQQPFKDVAEAYGGQYLRLDSKELSRMASFTSSSLEGTTAVVSGKSTTARGRKRRATNNIAIPVDDTVTTLVVTVATERSPHGVQLYTPTGRLPIFGKTLLSRGGSRGSQVSHATYL